MSVRDFSNDLDGQKLKHIAITFDSARGWLDHTSWIVLQAFEEGTAIPDRVKNYRADVRNVVIQRINQINGASTIEELEALELVSFPAIIEEIH